MAPGWILEDPRKSPMGTDQKPLLSNTLTDLYIPYRKETFQTFFFSLFAEALNFPTCIHGSCKGSSHYVPSGTWPFTYQKLPGNHANTTLCTQSWSLGIDHTPHDQPKSTLNFVPIGEGYPKVNENVHVDVTNAEEAVDCTSSTRFHDSIEEEKESLDEPSQDDAMPGPSPEGKHESIPSIDLSLITSIFLSRKS
jgi:hypothetical protein